MSASPPILSMRAVTKSYPAPSGPVPVLLHLDLDIAPGEFVAVTGPSGSGKSTLLNLAGLLDRPSSGAVVFDNRPVAGLAEAELSGIRKHAMGMVFQSFNLLPHRSVMDNVMFRFRYLDVPVAETRRRAAAALEQVGLAPLARKPVRLLSGGEMQRVAIARATAWPPRLLLADEPTGNLDEGSAHTVMELFARLHRQGMTIVMATHNLQLLGYCQRRLACHQGRVTEA
jgi:putative ABC transport system ATP-binding protein